MDSRLSSRPHYSPTAVLIILSTFLVRGELENSASGKIRLLYRDTGSRWLLLPDVYNNELNSSTSDSLGVVVDYWPNGLENRTEDYTLNTSLQAWFGHPNLLAKVEGQAVCPRSECATAQDCRPLYDCLYESGPLVGDPLDVPSHVGLLPAVWPLPFLDCFSARANEVLSPNELQCPFLIVNASTRGWSDDETVDCNAVAWQLTAANWIASDTDYNLQVFVEGGKDLLDIWWPGWNRSQTFSEALGLQLINNPLKCRLQDRCDTELICTQVGSRRHFGTGKPVIQTRWGYFALYAMENIHSQLSTQLQALQSAATAAVSATFNIAPFYPPLDKELFTLDLITGLGTLFAISSGFGPTLGKQASTLAAAILPAVGTYFDRHVKEQRSGLKPQEEFSPYLRTVIKVFEETLEEIADLLFSGQSIVGADSSFNITDLMKDGVWLDTEMLQPLTGLEEQIKVEIICRSINGFWLSPSTPHNKMWTTFYQLNDDPAGTVCANDRSGPQNMKFCGDGGVYYGYNFDMGATYQGKLAYPWGADQLGPLFNISSNWTAEGSARTYRLLKANNSDPFDFNSTSLTQRILSEALSPIDNSSTSSPIFGPTFSLPDSYGRIPGSWTLPVCDISGYGKNWNVDFEHIEQPEQFLPWALYPDPPHPPCMCGPRGEETKGWIKAAGMEGFETYRQRCTAVLKEKFEWPEDVPWVDFWEGVRIMRP